MLKILRWPDVPWYLLNVCLVRMKASWGKNEAAENWVSFILLKTFKLHKDECVGSCSGEITFNHKWCGIANHHKQDTPTAVKEGMVIWQYYNLIPSFVLCCLEGEGGYQPVLQCRAYSFCCRWQCVMTCNSRSREVQVSLACLLSTTWSYELLFHPSYYEKISELFLHFMTILICMTKCHFGCHCASI